MSLIVIIIQHYQTQGRLKVEGLAIPPYDPQERVDAFLNGRST